MKIYKTASIFEEILQYVCIRSSSVILAQTWHSLFDTRGNDNNSNSNRPSDVEISKEVRAILYSDLVYCVSPALYFCSFKIREALRNTRVLFGPIHTGYHNLASRAKASRCEPHQIPRSCSTLCTSSSSFAPQRGDLPRPCSQPLLPRFGLSRSSTFTATHVAAHPTSEFPPTNAGIGQDGAPGCCFELCLTGSRRRPDHLVVADQA